MSRHMPSQKYIRESLRYIASSGKLFWKERPLHHFLNVGAQKRWNSRWAGKRAFNSVVKDHGKKPRLYGALNARNYYAHRIIWKGVTGQEPIGLIDHEDRNSTNNRWKNLREANDQQNRRNHNLYANNTSKQAGVYRKGEKWVAQIAINGKYKYLGIFYDKQEAIQVRKDAEKKYFKGFRAK